MAHWNSETHDSFASEHVARLFQHSLSAFRGQALPPGLGSEAPANLNARSEVRVKGRNIQSNKTCEDVVAPQFGGKNAKAVLPKMRFDFVDQRIPLRRR